VEGLGWLIDGKLTDDKWSLVNSVEIGLGDNLMPVLQRWMVFVEFWMIDGMVHVSRSLICNFDS
jgi:hypothetical protein